MTIDDLFAPFITSADEPSAETEHAKAEVREFLRRRENRHLLHSAEFLRAALRHAEAMGIEQMSQEEFDAHLDEDATCPHCGNVMRTA